MKPAAIRIDDHARVAYDALPLDEARNNKAVYIARGASE